MTEQPDQDRKKVLSLSTRGKLELKKGPDTGQVRQSFSHGRSKTVQVEVKRKRTLEPAEIAPARQTTAAPPETPAATPASARVAVPRQLTDVEREARVRALRGAILEEEKRSHDVGEAPVAEEQAEPQPEVVLDADALRQRELEELRRIQEDERRLNEDSERKRQEEEAKRREVDDAEKKADEERRRVADRAGQSAAAKVAALMGQPASVTTEDEEEEARARAKRGVRPAPAKPVQQPRRGADRRRTGKITVTQALNEEEEKLRVRSLAAMRRARERERRQAGSVEQLKVTREVIIPDTITVQELANRMAERAGDVIKSLMRSGVIATITQSLDADTAELVATEFGHRVRRVSEADVVLGIAGEADDPKDLLPRPPVVTIMGHVDHGKTSLLDAIRRTDVAGGEAGGITQHIGAYQVTIANGERITFIDTPGHAAFTEMRARGANITDVVVLVVAADDGIMPQTVEAINHAQAAKVPIIVAINKSDLPDANPNRVRQELLNHNLVVEEMGGEVQAIEVSARTKQGIDRLLEGILLQAEILELQANPHRSAVGTVVEAKLERGRGSVATVLVQRGTLQVGDIFVAGGEWGRVRALVNDRGQNVYGAEPAVPVEVLGLNGTPLAGDDFVVVESEARAREITEFRQRKKRDAQAVAGSRGTLEQMFSQIQAGEKKELSVIVKGDVHGSVEAISGALQKMAEANTEVRVRVLHTGVGPVNESDVTLAKASNAIIAGFNVRANAQARDLARRDGIEIRYYSIIYDILDDVRAMLTGLLAPTLREQFLGNAAIREVFNITRIGKVAGCMVTEGVVRRGAKVRLLRDNVVIHEGMLKTLKRFKDEVREVREGFECGMAFENYDNIEVGDVIEAFEIQEVARQLA